MKYLFSNAFKNVLRQKKSYIFFSLQILISFVIMLVFGSVASSLNSDFGMMENDNTARSIYLDEIRSDGEREGSLLHYNSSPMTYEDYLWIKENYGDILSAAFALRSYFTALYNDGIAGFNALFVTDEYFRNAYENEKMLDFSEQKIIFAPEGTEQMRNLDDADGINERLQDFLDYAKNDGYTVKPVESVYNGKSDRVNVFTTMWYPNIEQDTEPLSDVMIAPIELYNKYMSEYDKYKDNDNNKYRNTMLSINFGGETDTGVFNEICSHLVAEKDPAGECIYGSLLSVFEEYAGAQIALAKLLQTISAVAMVITGVGFIGLILVIFNNRRKKLAVALVTGASYSDLYLEIILEIETVILTGALLGEIIGITALNVFNKQVTAFEFGTDIGLAVLLPILYAAMGIIISLAALYNLFKMEPNEILKKD